MCCYLLRTPCLCVSGIENLPCELQRNFQLMRELDQRTEGSFRPSVPLGRGGTRVLGWHWATRGPGSVGPQPSPRLCALDGVLARVLILQTKLSSLDSYTSSNHIPISISPPYSQNTDELFFLLKDFLISNYVCIV